ncbi:MAG: hypothetical protein H6811_11945 [Phycisphaeraceae bacterium]|nr:hypothetical protein [Phycisphaeraceae bacterium]
MSARANILAVLLVPWASATGICDPDTLYDRPGDARLHRTDPGANGPVSCSPPDLLSVRLRGWHAFDAESDPYAGFEVDPEGCHLFRADIVLEGLVNPAGTLGLNGNPCDPYRFGPNPVVGFIDFDIDRDRDTGGELGSAAEIRFLANVGRFAALPEGSLGSRAARSGDDYDLNFWTGPYFERSGADFAVVLCGCHDVEIVSGDDGDGVFEAGETWVVRSRFFQRAAGYRDASGVFGGSDFGLYDPLTNLRFRHSVSANTTTITLVEAMDMHGASELTGEPEQAPDNEIGPFSHHSVQEAVLDLIDAAQGSISEPARTLTKQWEHKGWDDAWDVSRWRATALIGAPYDTCDESLYAWSDVGFESEVGDFDSSGFVDGADALVFASGVASLDGMASDCDGMVDGRVVICDFGPNFSVFDVNYDGVIDASDLHAICPADLTGSSDPQSPDYGVPDGQVDGSDFFFFLDRFAAGDLARADLTGSADPGSGDYGDPDGVVDASDFFFYLDLFVIGCL